MRRSRPAGRTRLAGRAALVASVVAMHACVVHGIKQQMIDFEIASEMPARIELVYGRDMESTPPPDTVDAPPLPPKAVPPPRPDRQATPAAAAASAAARPVPRREPEPVAAVDASEVAAEEAAWKDPM